MAVKKRPPDFRETFTDGEIAQVLEAYSLSGWRVLAEVVQGHRVLRTASLQGTSRKAYVGRGRRTFVLKEVPWYCSDEDFVRSVTALQEELGRRGFPTPRLMLTRSGDRFATLRHSAGESHYLVQELATGRPWSGAPPELRSSARCLALFHRETDDLLRRDPSLVSGIPREDVFSTALAVVELVEEAITQAAPLDGPGRRELRRVMDDFRAEVDGRQREADARGYARLAIPVHGDFNQTNVLFHVDGAVAALLDFDNCCLDSPAHDAVQGLLHFCMFGLDVQTQLFSGMPRGVDPWAAGEFLDEYARGAAWFRDLEPVLVPVAVVVAVEISLLGFLNGSFEPGQLAKVRAIPERVARDCRTLGLAE